MKYTIDFLQGEKGRSNYRRFLKLTNKKSLLSLYEGTDFPKTYKYGDLLTIYMRSEPDKILVSCRNSDVLPENDSEMIPESSSQEIQSDERNNQRNSAQESDFSSEKPISVKKRRIELQPDVGVGNVPVEWTSIEPSTFVKEENGFLVKVQMKRSKDGSLLFKKDIYEKLEHSEKYKDISMRTNRIGILEHAF